MKPNFQKINIKSASGQKVSVKDWEQQYRKDEDWQTAEGIPVKHVYTADDLAGMEHLSYAAGLPPFLRGPY